MKKDSAWIIKRNLTPCELGGMEWDGYVLTTPLLWKERHYLCKFWDPLLAKQVAKALNKMRGNK